MIQDQMDEAMLRERQKTMKTVWMSVWLGFAVPVGMSIGVLFVWTGVL